MSTYSDRQPQPQCMQLEAEIEIYHWKTNPRKEALKTEMAI